MKQDIHTWSVLQPPLSTGSLIRVLGQMAVKNCFIRGSVVRYVQLPAEHVDTQLLEDATRRGKLQYIPPVPSL